MAKSGGGGSRGTQILNRTKRGQGSVRIRLGSNSILGRRGDRITLRSRDADRTRVRRTDGFGGSLISRGTFSDSDVRRALNRSNFTVLR